MAKKRILQDHTRQGKIFIPPLLTLGNFNAINWVDKLIPELIWIERIITTEGINEGINMLKDFVNICEQLGFGSKIQVYCKVSEYLNLNDDEKKRLIENMDGIKLREKLIKPLLPLMNNYPTFPLTFLIGSRQNPESENNKDLQLLKTDINSLYDRTNREAMFVQTASLLMQLHTGRVHLTKDTSLVQISEMIKYPITDLSVKVGSVVRATLNGMFGIFKPDVAHSDWAVDFWNQGLLLDNCYYSTLENESDTTF
jgi:hypothetical protein